MKKKKQPMDMPSSPSMQPEDGSEGDYHANDAYRSIVAAEGHKADPHMMKRVAKVAERHMAGHKAVMRSVQDIKDYTKKKYPPRLKYEKE